MTELKPCPFCGSDDLIIGDTDTEQTFCNGCGCYGPASTCYPFPQRTWNTRATPWQPIETAPKDGTDILGVYTPNGPYPSDFSITSWNGECWIGLCDGERSVRSQGDMYTEYHEPFFTHWMPLPSPPKDTGQ